MRSKPSQRVDNVVCGSRLSIATASTLGVSAVHRAPVHKVVLGADAVLHSGKLEVARAVVLPPMVPHQLIAMTRPYVIAYLDPRRFAFSDAQCLAGAWSKFEPGADDGAELFGEASARDRRRLDVRVKRILNQIEDGATVAEAAGKVRLSESRATHVVTDALGASPRQWRPWLLMCAAYASMVIDDVSATRAAAEAGFVDVAHFSRSCSKQIGASAAHIVPPKVTLIRDRER